MNSWLIRPLIKEVAVRIVINYPTTKIFHSSMFLKPSNGQRNLARLLPLLGIYLVVVAGLKGPNLKHDQIEAIEMVAVKAPETDGAVDEMMLALTHDEPKLVAVEEQPGLVDKPILLEVKEHSSGVINDNQADIVSEGIDLFSSTANVINDPSRETTSEALGSIARMASIVIPPPKGLIIGGTIGLVGGIFGLNNG